MSIKDVLFFFLLIFPAGRAEAQVATLNSKKVLSSVPAFAKIDTLVQAEQGKYVQEFMKKKYQTQILLGMADSLQRLSVRPASAEKTIASAQAALKDLQDYEADANKKVSDYKELLSAPYLEKVNDAVKAVARRLKYKQVVDMQQVPFVYVDTDADITDAVIAELQKK